MALGLALGLALVGVANHLREGRPHGYEDGEGLRELNSGRGWY